MTNTMTATESTPLAKDQTNRPDPEVPEKAQRRRFSVAFKLRVLEEADCCSEPGETGALLRREGLYSSLLVTWRKQRQEGTLSALSPRKRGRKPIPPNPLTGRVEELERENTRLRRKLAQAEAIVEIQKKISGLLGIPLNPNEAVGIV